MIGYHILKKCQYVNLFIFIYHNILYTYFTHHQITIYNISIIDNGHVYTQWHTLLNIYNRKFMT